MMMFILYLLSLKFERKTENMGFCTKERKGVAAEILMATPCTKSLGGEGRGQKEKKESKDFHQGVLKKIL